MTQEVVLSVAAIETLAGPYAGQLEATPQGPRSASAAGRRDRPLVAEPLSDGAARQGQRDARSEIQADQDSDVGQSNAEVAAEQRCYGGDALKLKAHGEANREQDGKHEPAVVQHLTPLKSPRNLGRGAAPVNRRASIATRQDWHRRGVHIGSPRPNKFNQQSRRAEERRMAML